VTLSANMEELWERRKRLLEEALRLAMQAAQRW
jgi:hypothetical protein